jgi:hypothetical protein
MLRKYPDSLLPICELIHNFRLRILCAAIGVGVYLKEPPSTKAIIKVIVDWLSACLTSDRLSSTFISQSITTPELFLHDKGTRTPA